MVSLDSGDGGGDASGSTSGGDDQPGGGGTTFGSTSGGKATGSSGGAARVRAQNSDGAVTLASGDVVFGGSVAPDARAGHGRAGADAPDAANGDRAATASAHGLWSGLSGAQGPATLAITDDLSATDELLLSGAGPTDRRVVVGAGLLGLGLIGLFAGFSVAELKRRRALSG